LAENSTAVGVRSASALARVCRYLEEAIAAEARSEAQSRGFAREGDDEDVRAAFARHAEDARLQQERLAQRLQELGGRLSERKSFLDQVLEGTPKLAESGGLQEEHTLQNLIVGFTTKKAECAMYEALAVTAEAAGDAATACLARDSQKEEAAAAEQLWHFLPSRSKIAYNMLTVAEVDPAVETKAATNRVV
jgi:ferritin-like metal-binding protein YciE